MPRGDSRRVSMHAQLLVPPASRGVARHFRGAVPPRTQFVLHSGPVGVAVFGEQAVVGPGRRTTVRVGNAPSDFANVLIEKRGDTWFQRLADSEDTLAVPLPSGAQLAFDEVVLTFDPVEGDGDVLKTPLQAGQAVAALGINGLPHITGDAAAGPGNHVSIQSDGPSAVPYSVDHAEPAASEQLELGSPSEQVTETEPARQVLPVAHPEKAKNERLEQDRLTVPAAEYAHAEHAGLPSGCTQEARALAQLLAPAEQGVFVGQAPCEGQAPEAGQAAQLAIAAETLQIAQREQAAQAAPAQPEPAAAPSAQAALNLLAPAAQHLAELARRPRPSFRHQESQRSAHHSNKARVTKQTARAPAGRVPVTIIAGTPGGLAGSALLPFAAPEFQAVPTPAASPAAHLVNKSFSTTPSKASRAPRKDSNTVIEVPRTPVMRMAPSVPSSNVAETACATDGAGESPAPSAVASISSVLTAGTHTPADMQPLMHTLQQHTEAIEGLRQETSRLATAVSTLNARLNRTVRIVEEGNSSAAAALAAQVSTAHSEHAANMQYLFQSAFAKLQAAVTQTQQGNSGKLDELLIALAHGEEE